MTRWTLFPGRDQIQALQNVAFPVHNQSSVLHWLPQTLKAAPRLNLSAAHRQTRPHTSARTLGLGAPLVSSPLTRPSALWIIKTASLYRALRSILSHIPTRSSHQCLLHFHPPLLAALSCLPSLHLGLLSMAEWVCHSKFSSLLSLVVHLSLSQPLTLNQACLNNLPQRHQLISPLTNKQRALMQNLTRSFVPGKAVLVLIQSSIQGMYLRAVSLILLPHKYLLVETPLPAQLRQVFIPTHHQRADARNSAAVYLI